MSAVAGPVAVTGALGFVASRLLQRLIGRGTRVIGIVRPGRDAARLASAGVEVRFADLSEPAAQPHAFDGARAVVHLAGVAQAPGLVPALRDAGVERAVFVSSAGVHTRLPGAGAAAKREGEAAVRASGLAWTILRPSMIYGTPGDRNLARLLRWLRVMPVVPIPGGGHTPQQPVHVDDLVAAIVAALERPAAAGRDYDLGGPEPLTLRQLIAQSGAAVGRRARVLPLPLRPVWRALQIARRLGLPTPLRPEQILRLEESKAVDITPARTDLGFAPRPFSEGIRAEAAELLSGAR
ncbi:MAG: NAD(P)H-binding protein [Candidatus Eisenbacteria bacterium]|nr:NAD(P)H-binding protein [Candidatus Eisenbacteria bacterium]